MLTPRPTLPRLFGLLGVAGATLMVNSCDTSSAFGPNDRLWGFVQINALKSATGDHFTAPNGSFFRGQLSSIPNAGLKPDSCYPAVDYVAPTSTFEGATYLDAGASITTVLSGVTTEIPRVSQAAVTTYSLPSGTTLSYHPGDSVVVTIPGAAGGYPAVTLRSKTAEPLNIQDIQPVSSGYLQLRWNAATDNNGALVLSLQFTPTGTGAKTREIRCAFVDDGVDSISFAQQESWSLASNVNRTAIATRLRTNILGVGDGALEVISTYQVPTPPKP